MPVSAQSITVSGISNTAAVGEVIVTFDSNQMGATLPWPNAGNQMQVPGIMWLQGDVKFRKDNQGNVYAENPNADGSFAV